MASRDELGMLTRSFNSMTRAARRSARRRPSTTKRELAHAKAHLESILANLSAGVLAFDEHLQLRSANRSAGSDPGVDCAPLIGASSERWDARRSVARRRSQRRSATAFRSGAARRMGAAGRARTRRTARRCCCCAARACRRAPRPAYVVVFDDITHLLQAQRDAAWAEVARRLAHEIKNPLTPIQLSAERLRAEARAASSPHADAEMLTRSTRTIVNQVAALKRMVDAFSQYARTPEPVMRELDLNALVREVLTLYESLGSSIERRARADDLPRIIGDAAQLRQVVHNLLQNAQDALAEAPSARASSIAQRGRRARRCASRSPTTARAFPRT